jgi:hypothetical protein
MAIDLPARKGRHYPRRLFLPQQAGEQVFVPEADAIARNQLPLASLFTRWALEFHNVAFRV